MKLHVEYEGRVCDYELHPIAIIGAVFLVALKIVGVPALIVGGILVFLYGIYCCIENM